jgi:hypothetical protein
MDKVELEKRTKQFALRVIAFAHLAIGSGKSWQLNPRIEI